MERGEGGRGHDIQKVSERNWAYERGTPFPARGPHKFDEPLFVPNVPVSLDVWCISQSWHRKSGKTDIHDGDFDAS